MIYPTQRKVFSTATNFLLNSLASVFVLCLPLTIYFPASKPVAEKIFELYVTPEIYLTDILMGLMLVCALLQLMLERRKPLRAPALEGVLIALLAGAGFASIPGAMSQSLALYQSLRWVVYLVTGWVLLQVIGKQGQKFEKLFLLGLLPHLLIGLLQMVHHNPLGLPLEVALPDSNPRAAILYLQGFSLYRPYGLTFHPNVFGGLMAVGFLLSLRLQPTRWHWGLRGSLLLGVLASFSRSAWLGLGVAILPLIFVFFQKHPYRFKKKHLAWIIPAALILAAAAPFILSRFNLSSLSENASLAARGQMIQVALNAIQQRPLTGIGAGNFPLYMDRFDLVEPSQYVHNVPLLITSETGVPGGVVWLIFFMMPIVRFMLQKQSNWQSYPLVAAWLALGIIGLWDNYPGTLENVRLLGLLLLVWIALEPPEAKNES